MDSAQQQLADDLYAIRFEIPSSWLILCLEYGLPHPDLTWVALDDSCLECGRPSCDGTCTDTSH